MTLMDAAASTAFALRASSSSSGSGSGVVQQQQDVRETTAHHRARETKTSAATRLGSIDPAPPAARSSDSTGKKERTTSRLTPPPPPRPPLFSFGAIADVQYADQDDGWNFRKDYKRYYRGGLRQLRGAVDVWLRDETHRFALQLGDVIDGSNKRQGQSEAALTSVKTEVDRLATSLPLGVLNSLGNHELYNFPKQRWARELDCSNRAKAVTLRPSGPPIGVAVEPSKPLTPEHRPELDANARAAGPPPPPPLPASGLVLSAAAGEDNNTAAAEEEEEEEGEEIFYYSFCPDDSHRFIALDSYDVNAIREELGPGENEDAEEEEEEEKDGKKKDNGDGVVAGDGAQAGMEVLSKHNPNRNKNDGSGMDGLTKRFVQYNGGMSAKQLLWLEDELTEASQAGQRVISFGHVPIHPAERGSHTLLWNYEDVLEVMHKFDCVAMFLSGHRHRETYIRDDHGIHHVSLAAALEAPADQEAFASIDVYPDCLELRGHGVVESRTLALGALAEVS